VHDHPTSEDVQVLPVITPTGGADRAPTTTEQGRPGTPRVALRTSGSRARGLPRLLRPRRNHLHPPGRPPTRPSPRTPQPDQDPSSTRPQQPRRTRLTPDSRDVALHALGVAAGALAVGGAPWYALAALAAAYTLTIKDPRP